MKILSRVSLCLKSLNMCQTFELLECEESERFEDHHCSYDGYDADDGHDSTAFRHSFDVDHSCGVSHGVWWS